MLDRRGKVVARFDRFADDLGVVDVVPRGGGHRDNRFLSCSRRVCHSSLSRARRDCRCDGKGHSDTGCAERAGAADPRCDNRYQ